jgi:hypothetical protein
LPVQDEPRLQWKRIAGSSNVAEVGYSEGNLYVKYKPRDATYVYYNVPKHHYVRLLRSPSKGKYLHRHIRGIFNYDRLA